MNLSPHFQLSEMTVTHSGFPNVPNGAQLENLVSLCNHVLEEIRGQFGPVIVTSGFRSPEVNKSAGGANTSQHLYGQAADIHCAGTPNATLWQWIVDKLEFDQVIAERLKKADGTAGWVHVSFSTGRNKKQALSSPHEGHYAPGLVYAA